MAPKGGKANGSKGGSTEEEEPFIDPYEDQRSAKNKGKKNFVNKAVVNYITMMFIPFIIFAGVLLFYVYMYHSFFHIAWLMSLCLVLFSAVWIFSDLLTREGGQWYVFFGVLCLLASIAATLVGLYIYFEYTFQFYKLGGLRTYSNVLPSEPAASHADAGKIYFSPDAKVDITRAVGFKAQGGVYCVAPILDDTEIARVNFWAVGRDCCNSRASFNCDEAWNGEAHAGAVVMDSGAPQVSFNQMDFYWKAVKEAQALYDLASADPPIFVRWVLDPAVMQTTFWTLGQKECIYWLVGYFLVSMFLGALFNYCSAKRAAVQKKELEYAEM
jgi:hypothetical protein